MALKKRQPNKGSFQPGHKSTGGRVPLPDICKVKARETKPQIILSYSELASMTPAKLKAHKPRTAIEAGIQTCLLAFIDSGKTDQIRHIWAECHGKPVESVDIQGNIETKIEIEFVNADSNSSET